MTPFEKLQAQRATWLPQNRADSFINEMRMNAAMKEAIPAMGQQIQQQMPYRIAEANVDPRQPESTMDMYKQVIAEQSGDRSSLPMNTPVPGSARSKMDQEQNKQRTQAQNQYEKRMREFMKLREGLIKNDQERARLVRGAEGQVDLSSLMALVDSETGSNLSRGYKRPMSAQERERLAMALEQRAGQGYGALANNEYMMGQLQNQRDAAKRNAELRKALALNRLDKPFSGEIQKRVSYIQDAQTAIGDMSKNLAGVNTAANLTGIGSNPFTVARDAFVQSLARMESGAAISKSEEKLFAKYAPKITDSDDMRKYKLDKVNFMMNRRLQNIMNGRPTKPITERDLQIDSKKEPAVNYTPQDVQGAMAELKKRGKA